VQHFSFPTSVDDKELSEFLNSKVEQYETTDFIATDPIQIPHRFSKIEDIEISAFLTAMIAWGQRTSIIKNADKLMEIMDNSPHQFVLNFSNKDLNFVHRTFNYIDLNFFLRSLQNIYLNGTLETLFAPHKTIDGVFGRIANFREHFLAVSHEKRSEKHISNPLKNSACKRINMFLRWMVRSNTKGVDFGLWRSIKPSELYLPLDAHSSKNARKLGILTRQQNDWKALEEIMPHLRLWDANDPVKYDFALFGLGAFENF